MKNLKKWKILFEPRTFQEKASLENATVELTLNIKLNKQTKNKWLVQILWTMI